MKMPHLHNDGDVTRNYVAYNFQTLRDDVYMLARDGDVTGNRIGPARSSCAIHVGSYNDNRESIYVQQQTISAEGLSGIAFSTNVPHTVRGKDETKTCTDCHVSHKNDNNAIMAQLLMQGTSYVNFMGRYCWVAAGEHGLDGGRRDRAARSRRRSSAARCTSSPSPTTSSKHVEHGRKLQARPRASRPGHQRQAAASAASKAEILQVQPRGEYLYAACGEGGLRVFDIAFIDDKGFSERITTAPVSPLGQKFYVPTQVRHGRRRPDARWPPTRRATHHPENQEPTVHAAVRLPLRRRQVRGPDPGRRRARRSTATRSTTSSSAT